MIKTFPIEYVRQALEQTLLIEHNKNLNYFGGTNQISLSSFYQQLKNQADVDRFVETFRDLTDQQNRMGLIGNGILLSPENPTITNLYSCLIIPMAWTCAMRTKLADRDQMLETINNLIEELKGTKVDIAELDCINENGFHYAQPFMVGTIGHNEGEPELKDGDYIGLSTNVTNTKAAFDNYIAKGVVVDKDKEYLLYAKNNANKLIVVKVKYNNQGEPYEVANIDATGIDVGLKVKVTCNVTISGTFSEPPLVYDVSANYTLVGAPDEHAYCENVKGTITDATVNAQGVVTYTIEFETANPAFYPASVSFEFINIYSSVLTRELIHNDGTYDDFVFPPEHNSFEQYKLSLSFDSLRCDDPRTLNADEYCEISFGGSATIVSNGVKLGNDLIKIAVTKYGISGKTPFINPDTYYLEPLEMPSGNNANTKINQLVSNNFVSNTHTDAIALTLQYSFIADESIEILDQWFEYGRYGTQGLTKDDISPNTIYNVREIWSSWGVYKNRDIKTKLVESIDIENTESDSLTLGITMQIQGDND